jgi:hypothetical protein
MGNITEPKVVQYDAKVVQYDAKFVQCDAKFVPYDAIFVPYETTDFISYQLPAADFLRMAV